MAKAVFYHVTRARDGQWHVKQKRSKNSLSAHIIKEEAIEKALSLAQEVILGRVVIHRDDGTFEAIKKVEHLLK